MTYAEANMYRLGLTRCPMCPGNSAVIPFDGPIDADCLFIGSKPGKEEASRGKAFVGQTGKELNSTYLPLAGTPRETVRFGNSCCCFHDMPDDSDRAVQLMFSCAGHHLKREIEQQNPKVIVPMGAAACRLVDGLDIEKQHGIPMIGTSWWGKTIDTFPTYHPAAGLHATDIMTELLEDFEDLGRFLRGELTAPVDEYPDPDYRLLKGKKQVLSILDQRSIYDIIYVDTEFEPDVSIIVNERWYRDRIYCLSFCFTPGTGYVIKVDDTEGMAAFTEWMMTRHRGQVCYHSAIADMPMLEQVGVTTPIRRVDDTMERSYLLQRTPQGLKALAYRLAGMHMDDFLDVVTPYAVDLMAEWIINISMDDWPKPAEQMVLDGKTGEYKKYKPQGLNTKIKRLITDFTKNPGHKVFKRVGEWDEEQMLPVIDKYGYIPKPNIKYVPEKHLIRYAARDADATCRVRAMLIKLKRRIRHVA